MKIRNESITLTSDSIKKIENYYNATFVLSSSIKNKHGDWINYPVDIFYTKIAHPKGSNYFAIYTDELGSLIITNGLSGIEGVIFKGILVDGEVHYSRYRHDFRTVGSYSIDGGRDYLKFGYTEEPPEIIKFMVEKDQLKVLDNET